jgi:hypothetical protein
VVSVAGRNAAPFPALYQLREHAAALIWDSRAEESRYSGLERGQVEFRDNSRSGQTDMIVTGRADPGLLEFQPGGRRGFTARSVYRWNGQAYIPEQTEYSPGPDYTLYRFIAALHLHDFRNAYAEIDPAKFLHTDAPTLDKFRRVIKETYPEFLEDHIFRVREMDAGLSGAFAFELPRLNYVYRPRLGDDGRFLLIDLGRKIEMSPSDSSETSQ